MKWKHKWTLLVPFLLLTPTLITPPTPVHADSVILEKPNLFIDEKGKVDVKSEDGTVESKENLVTEFIKKYRFIIAGISGIGTMSMILFFILGFINLGATSSNPEGRGRVITGLICSGVGAAGLGAVTLITGIFMNAV